MSYMEDGAPADVVSLGSADHSLAPRGQERSSAHPSRIRRTLLFIWPFVAIALVITAWSIATPLMAAPDEPSHAADAAAVVRGEFDVPEARGPIGELAHVRVPEWVASAAFLPGCFEFKPKVPAGCSPKLNSSSAPAQATTQFSHYPPLYYLLIGIPSLVARGTNALYSMRMVGTLLNAALIALGLFLLARYHQRRRVWAGVIVALTPMVFFVSSVMNSSGMEIATAFAAWCGGLCIVECRPIPRALIVWTSLAFILLILSRPISPVNAAVIVVVVCTSAGWARTKEIARDREARVLILSLCITGLGAAILLAIDGTPSLLGVPMSPRLSLGSSIWLTLRLTEYRLRQAIGQFGWLDTPIPEAVFAIWTVAVASVVGVGLVISRRSRRALLLLAATSLAMPIIFESPRIDQVGPYWQGRYWLPLLVGIPLVALASSGSTSPRHGRRRTSNRSVPFTVLLLGVVLAGCQVWSFLTALHRYEYGFGVTSPTIAHWQPPGGPALVLSLFIVGFLLFLAFVAFSAFKSNPAESSTVPNPDPGRRGRGLRLATV